MPEKNQIIHILIEEFHDTISRLGSVIARTARFPDAPNKIKVAIGMRRTGKTYFLYQYILTLLKENIPPRRILYLNFEDDRLLPLNAAKLADLIESFYSLYPDNHDHRCYLFLDEIQNVDDWSTVLRRFYDKKNIEIFLTGSSAKLLSKEIATSLRGRSLATEIWPYSFHEFCIAKNIATDMAIKGKKAMDNLKNAFLSYMQSGGFPEVINYSRDVRQQTLQEYVDVVIYRDIIERHKLSASPLMKYFILTMLHNVSRSFTINKAYNDLKSQGYKLTKDTLYEYASYIEDAYLAFSLPLYSKSIRKVHSNPKKVYAIDPGLIRALTMDDQNDLGRLFKNIIYLDLRRNEFNVHYYLTEKRNEIDFLLQDKKGHQHLLQVAWNMEDKTTFEREQYSLDNAIKETNLPGHIITLESYLSEGINIPV